jgi:hypothetical protein
MKKLLVYWKNPTKPSPIPFNYDNFKITADGLEIVRMDRRTYYTFKDIKQIKNHKGVVIYESD